MILYADCPLYLPAAMSAGNVPVCVCLHGKMWSLETSFVLRTNMDLLRIMPSIYTSFCQSFVILSEMNWCLVFDISSNSGHIL